MADDDKDVSPFVLDDVAQGKFPFVEGSEYNVKLVGTTPEGYGLYRRLEGHGGYSYWTDEVAPAVCVYDEGISNIVSTFAALNDLQVGELLWRHIGEVFGYKA